MSFYKLSFKPYVLPVLLSSFLAVSSAWGAATQEGPPTKTSNQLSVPDYKNTEESAQAGTLTPISPLEPHTTPVRTPAFTSYEETSFFKGFSGNHQEKSSFFIGYEEDFSSRSQEGFFIKNCQSLFTCQNLSFSKKKGIKSFKAATSSPHTVEAPF